MEFGKFPSVASIGFLLLLLIFEGCSRRPIEIPDIIPEVSPTPAPAQPTPPLYVPSKRMETAKLFNGMQLRSSVETENGSMASIERDDPTSYTLDLQVKVKVPKPNTTLQELSRLNDQLPVLLPGLEAMTTQSNVSQFYEELYSLKLRALQQNLGRLDQLISRHNFYDCETILELEHPLTKRKALLIQADMDVDMDGSDSDRMIPTDNTPLNFQPMTSYKWPKKTQTPNPFLASREEKLKQLESEYATKGLSIQRNQELRTAIPPLRYEVNELKKQSFLISATDPYIVLPGSIVGQNQQPFTPKLGDYCLVIFNNVIYPAIVGDVGPKYKMGEASLRLSKEINNKSTAYSRPVSNLKVTYLVFPNSADKPFDAPDLAKWSTRCEELVNEIGGAGVQIHVWEDLIKPIPTPSPTPELTIPQDQFSTPSPSPSLDLTPAPIVSPTPSASVTPDQESVE